MKIFSLPATLPAPEPNYRNYDSAREQAREDDHRALLKAYLIRMGYTGKYTGEVYRAQIADGYAQYMMLDGRVSGLIHLPYGDGYQCPNVQHLSKRVIVQRIETDKRWSALFASRRADIDAKRARAD